MLFVLAVLASTQNLTVGLPQSALLLGLALIAVRFFREDRAGLVKSALICLGLGITLRIFNNPIAQVVSDSVIAVSMTVVAVYLIGPPLVRFVIRSRLMLREATNLLVRTTSAAPESAGSADSAVVRISIPFVVAAAAILLILIAGPQRLVGAESAQLQWNAHIITSHLVREATHLKDPSIGLSGTSGVFVTVPDSLLLSGLKLVYPYAWAQSVANRGALFGFGLFVLAAVLFLEKLSLGRAEAIAATVLFLLLPVGLEPRFAAPLDLSIPLLTATLLMSVRADPRLYLSAAFLNGFCNSANGYEFAVLVLVLRAFKLMPRPLTALAAALSVAGSLIASWLLHSMAPAASLREAWWFAQEIPRIAWAENLSAGVIAIVVFAILAAIGAYAMARRRALPLLWSTLTLALSAAILAIPTRLGGIPIVSPADVLRILAPAGWPTARFLELAAFALTIPVAYAASAIFHMYSLRRTRYSLIVAWISAAIIFVLCFPQSRAGVLPNVAAGTSIVEFPIAEAGSRAGIIYAQELLAAKARIVQPLIFLDLPSPLAVPSSPAQSSTIKTMQNLGVQLVVLRPELYAKPRLRTAEPELYDASASVEPGLGQPYPFKVFTPVSEGG